MRIKVPADTGATLRTPEAWRLVASFLELGVRRSASGRAWQSPPIE